MFRIITSKLNPRRIALVNDRGRKVLYMIEKRHSGNFRILKSTDPAVASVKFISDDSLKIFKDDISPKELVTILLTEFGFTSLTYTKKVADYYDIPNFCDYELDIWNRFSTTVVINPLLSSKKKKLFRESIIDALSDIISKGFEGIIYDSVMSVGDLGTSARGKYYPNEDVIVISDKIADKSVIEKIINHEYGHRFENLDRNRTKIASDMFDSHIVNKGNYKLPEIGTMINADCAKIRFKNEEFYEVIDRDTKEGIITLKNSKETLRGNIYSFIKNGFDIPVGENIPYAISYFENVKMEYTGIFPSRYAMTNHKEMVAECFSAYIHDLANKETIDFIDSMR